MDLYVVSCLLTVSNDSLCLAQPIDRQTLGFAIDQNSFQSRWLTTLKDFNQFILKRKVFAWNGRDSLTARQFFSFRKQRIHAWRLGSRHSKTKYKFKLALFCTFPHAFEKTLSFLPLKKKLLQIKLFWQQNIDKFEHFVLPERDYCCPRNYG